MAIGTESEHVDDKAVEQGLEIQPPTYQELVTTSIPSQVGVQDSNPAWGNKFKDDQTFNWRLCFNYTTVPPGQHLKRSDWYAAITFHIKDLPKFMREGFYWSPEDCLPELGCYQNNPSLMNAFEKARKHSIVRIYTLVDRTKDAMWHGEVRVGFQRPGTAATFRLEQLTADELFRCTAANPDNMLVYEWSADRPSCENTNAIYDDMPMGGRWPWPKAEEQVATEEIKAKS